MAYSETLRMEAALCIWEAMLEAREESKLVAPTWQTELEHAFRGRGSVEMRHVAIALSDDALRTFELIGSHEGAEELDLIPYDWEFIPAFVALVDWTNCIAQPAKIAASLKARKQGEAA